MANKWDELLKEVTQKRDEFNMLVRTIPSLKETKRIVQDELVQKKGELFETEKKLARVNEKITKAKKKYNVWIKEQFDNLQKFKESVVNDLTAHKNSLDKREDEIAKTKAIVTGKHYISFLLW